MQVGYGTRRSVTVTQVSVRLTHHRFLTSTRAFCHDWESQSFGVGPFDRGRTNLYTRGARMEGKEGACAAAAFSRGLPKGPHDGENDPPPLVSSRCYCCGRQLCSRPTRARGSRPTSHGPKPWTTTSTLVLGGLHPWTRGSRDIIDMLITYARSNQLHGARGPGRFVNTDYRCANHLINPW